jgi:type I restriction enzyme S subunit
MLNKNSALPKHVDGRSRDLTRLGVRAIPEGWKLSTVGQACTIQNEYRLPLSVETRAGMSGPYPYYGPTGILDYLNEFRVEGEFVLIGEDGDHFLDFESKPQTIRVDGRFNVNNHAHLLRGTALCSIRWLHYFFQHRDIFHSLTRQGAGRFKLTKASLEKLPILLPPRRFQDAAGSILETWDIAIAQLERRLAASNKMHKALVESLIDRRSRDRNWSEILLGEITNERTEKSVRNNQYPILTSSRRGIFLQNEYFTRNVTSRDNTGYKIIRANDFTFRSMSDDGHFVFNRQTITETGIISPAYAVFTATNVDPSFLYFLLNSAVFVSALKREAQGGTRTALRFSAMKRLKIRLPSLVVQRRIGDALELSLRSIKLQESLIAARRKQKLGLMRKLLTGEWQVKEAA